MRSPTASIVASRFRLHKSGEEPHGRLLAMLCARSTPLLQPRYMVYFRSRSKSFGVNQQPHVHSRGFSVHSITYPLPLLARVLFFCFFPKKTKKKVDVPPWEAALMSSSKSNKEKKKEEAAKRQAKEEEARKVGAVRACACTCACTRLPVMFLRACDKSLERSSAIRLAAPPARRSCADC